MKTESLWLFKPIVLEVKMSQKYLYGISHNYYPKPYRGESHYAKTGTCIVLFSSSDLFLTKRLPDLFKYHITLLRIDVFKEKGTEKTFYY